MKKVLLFAVIMGMIPIFLFPLGNFSKYWIYFKDKGIKNQSQYENEIAKLENSYNSHALARRKKVNTGNPFSYTDLPVCSDYITSLDRMGIKIDRISKWLNAVSVTASSSQIEEIRGLNFVKEITPVRKYVLKENNKINIIKPKNARAMYSTINWDYDYWFDVTQISKLNIQPIHHKGFNGAGVRIAIFSTGFELTHQCLASIQSNIMAKKDFLYNDTIVSYDPTQDSINEIEEGTASLSIIGGYYPGAFVGPAFASNFILAKIKKAGVTDTTDEDNWIAACEWADSIGADIIYSDIGVNDWYTPDQMDGNTCAITKEADLAASKGILVAQPIGDKYSSSYMMAPADGDSVLTVGATDNDDKYLASVSIAGPTADGRIKPDVATLGEGVAYAATKALTVYDSSGSADTTIDVDTTYLESDGTGLAAAMIAGAAALLLQSHPKWSPIQVKNALAQYASNISAPDNEIGAGIPDLYKSYNL
ncbi:MAG: S8 family serine peptidase, partial [Proteobacteria bacterium]|nr:S8 family serine peptidase [Pseudomonadota bacterium]